jgi:S-adenosylmethionine synthetase
MARYIAKNIVAADLAEKCSVQLAYVIGRADPVSVQVETFGTGRLPESKLEKLIRRHFPLTPLGMIEELKLRQPIYLKTACYGHFGRSGESFSWERTDKAPLLRDEAARKGK